MSTIINKLINYKKKNVIQKIVSAMIEYTYDLNFIVQTKQLMINIKENLLISFQS